MQKRPTRFETTTLVLSGLLKSQPTALVPALILPANANDGRAKDLDTLDNIPEDDSKGSAGYRPPKPPRTTPTLNRPHTVSHKLWPDYYDNLWGGVHLKYQTLQSGKLHACAVSRFDLDGDLVGATCNEERVKTASRLDLRPATSAKFLNSLVVHPLVASKDSNLGVIAMAHRNPAISRFHAVASAHVRDAGCRYHGVLNIRGSAAFVFQLGIVRGFSLSRQQM